MRWQPRQLRHSIGTDIRRLHGIEAAQDYLGHIRPDATLIYAERSTERVVEIAIGIELPFNVANLLSE